MNQEKIVAILYGGGVARASGGLRTNVLPLDCLLSAVTYSFLRTSQKSSVLAEEIVSFAIDVYLLMVGKDSISQRTDVLRSREQQ